MTWEPKEKGNCKLMALCYKSHVELIKVEGERKGINKYIDINLVHVLIKILIIIIKPKDSIE